jgi:hypothetical protein
MGATDLEALLGETGTTREQVAHDARMQAVDLTGTIHDEIRRLGESLDTKRTPNRPISWDPVAAVEEIEELLRELLSHLEVLIVVEGATIKEVTVDNIAPWDVAPYLMIAASAHRGARTADRTDASPTPRSSSRAALDIALNRVDRYVRGIAEALGHSVDDEEPASAQTSREKDL